MDRNIGINLAVGLAFLVPCVVWDVRSHMIPTWYLLSWVAAGVIGRIAFQCQGRIELTDTLLSLLPGCGLLLIAWATREKIGLGDGVCFLVLGLLEGGGICVCVLLFSFLLSSIFGILLLVIRRVGLQKRIPFLPFILCGMAAETLCLLI